MTPSPFQDAMVAMKASVDAEMYLGALDSVDEFTLCSTMLAAGAGRGTITQAVVDLRSTRLTPEYQEARNNTRQQITDGFMPGSAPVTAEAV
jgi:hypothetical protein